MDYVDIIQDMCIKDVFGETGFRFNEIRGVIHKITFRNTDKHYLQSKGIVDNLFIIGFKSPDQIEDFKSQVKRDISSLDIEILDIIFQKRALLYECFFYYSNT